MSSENMVQIERHPIAFTRAIRLIMALGSAALLIGAADPETRIAVTLQPDLVKDASGRLLVFAVPATRENMASDAVDLERGGDVSVVARDVASFRASRS